MNKPVAWINRKGKDGEHGYLEWDKDDDAEINTPLYTQEALEEARKLGMQQERALWNLAESTQEIMNTHPVKELTDEEITAISKEIFKDYKNFHYYQIDFARAIMKRCGIISGTDK